MTEHVMCKDCKCWTIPERLKHRSEDLRECRRFPPYVVAVQTVMAIYPVTGREWGCWSGIKDVTVSVTVINESDRDLKVEPGERPGEVKVTRTRQTKKAIKAKGGKKKKRRA